MKTAIWQRRLADVATKYGDQAPLATVCCNACRTCTTTNVLTFATAAGMGVIYAGARLARRVVKRS